jgi:hypothetical protein
MLLLVQTILLLVPLNFEGGIVVHSDILTRSSSYPPVISDRATSQVKANFLASDQGLCPSLANITPSVCGSIFRHHGQS